MTQSQYSDAELDAVARAVTKLQAAHDQAKARSMQFGVDHCYVIHTYGYNSVGERVDNYAPGTVRYHPGPGLVSKIVASYCQGQEVPV